MRLNFTAPTRWDDRDRLFFGGDSHTRAHFAAAEVTGSDTNNLRDAIPAPSRVVGTCSVSAYTPGASP
jgi:hypothetical protein